MIPISRYDSLVARHILSKASSHLLLCDWDTFKENKAVLYIGQIVHCVYNNSQGYSEANWGEFKK